MKKAKIFLILVSINFLALFTQFGQAAKIDYVGIKEGDVFVWKYTFDEDVFKEWARDLNNTIGIDLDFDYNIQGMKWEINDIDDDEDEFYGYDGVEVKLTRYFTEQIDDEDKWEEDKDFNSTVIYDYDDDIYCGLCIFPFPLIATNVDWEDLIDALGDFDDIEEIDDIDAEKSGNDLIIKTEWKGMDDQINTIRYTSAGVLEYFELKYDDEQAFLIELQGIIPGYQLISLIGFSALATLALVIILKRKI
ncbi:MAG: hypothetical protein ACP6IY_19585 [Promethearchaeia archaeon]